MVTRCWFTDGRKKKHVVPSNEMKIYSQIHELYKKGQKQIALLVDPDKVDKEQLEDLCIRAMSARVDYLFVGGSLLTNGNLPTVVKFLKSNTKIPVILFPGDNMQVDAHADAILFLSLISGRNPDLLIGKQVASAPLIKEKQLEAIATGYMLIESGNITSAQYMSNTNPIPADKVDIASCTALAAELMGMKMIFMDAGSGAANPVSLEMIKTVKDQINIPLAVGGGIHTAEKAIANCNAGADIIVVGNCIENNPELIDDLSNAVHSVQAVHSI